MLTSPKHQQPTLWLNTTSCHIFTRNDLDQRKWVTRKINSHLPLQTPCLKTRRDLIKLAIILQTDSTTLAP